MAEIIEMPKLSDTMTEGVVAAWHVKVGDKIAAGDLLAEVETDKATMELESYFDGVVLHLALEEGAAVPIGQLMAVIGKEGEDLDQILADYQANKGGAPAANSEPPAEAPVLSHEPPSAVAQTAPSTAPNNDTRLKASPLAKAMAREKGIDLQALQGSGDGGRIVKRDIEEAAVSTPAAPLAASVSAASEVPVTAPAAASSTGDAYTDEPLSQMRKTIARRLAESKFTAPHFYLTIPIRMERTAAFRQELNAESDVKVSFNDLMIKAVAVALRQHPKVNASWLGDKIRYHHHINIGMAVAVDEGLLVPVIRNADNLGLSTIARQSRDFAERARARKLKPEEMQGNTFSVSNLGMMGIEQFTAIINPPDACILAIGAIQDEPVVEGGQIVPGKVLRVTLSNDHRVVDGALGAAFLQTLKALLENPIRLLL
jgi:pyruvate dehydrogenase E2 component (dihydrolipoamide acetyltransferase)